MLASWHAGDFNPSKGEEKALKKAQEFYKQNAIFDFNSPCTKSKVFKTYHGPKGRVEWCGVIPEQFEFKNYRTVFALTPSEEVVYCKNTWGPTIHISSGKVYEEELSIMQEIHLDNGKIKCECVFMFITTKYQKV